MMLRECFEKLESVHSIRDTLFQFVRFGVHEHVPSESVDVIYLDPPYSVMCASDFLLSLNTHHFRLIPIFYWRG